MRRFALVSMIVLAGCGDTITAVELEDLSGWWSGRLTVLIPLGGSPTVRPFGDAGLPGRAVTIWIIDAADEGQIMGTVFSDWMGDQAFDGQRIGDTLTFTLQSHGAQFEVVRTVPNTLSGRAFIPFADGGTVVTRAYAVTLRATSAPRPVEK